MLGTLNQDQIDAVLSSQSYGRIGCSAEGRIYVVPVSYAYDGCYIYGHSSSGMKLRMMRLNPEVCFEVDRVENMANWQSVIAWGTYEELHGEEAMSGLKFLLGRLIPYITSETTTPMHGIIDPVAHHANNHGHNSGATVYRIRLHEKTGRFEKRT